MNTLYYATAVCLLCSQLSGCVCCLVKRYCEACEALPSDLTPVTDAFEHALLARYPRPRYRVGFSAVLMSVLAMLPEFIGDWILAKRLQLPVPVT